MEKHKKGIKSQWYDLKIQMSFFLSLQLYWFIFIYLAKVKF